MALVQYRISNLCGRAEKLGMASLHSQCPKEWIYGSGKLLVICRCSCHGSRVKPKRPPYKKPPVLKVIRGFQGEKLNVYGYCACDQPITNFKELWNHPALCTTCRRIEWNKQARMPSRGTDPLLYEDPERYLGKH